MSSRRPPLPLPHFSLQYIPLFEAGTFQTCDGPAGLALSQVTSYLCRHEWGRGERWGGGVGHLLLEACSSQTWDESAGLLSSNKHAVQA